MVSVGRGTDFPFQVVGFPNEGQGKFSFTPISIPGVSKYPKHENKKCYGTDLRNWKPKKELNLNYLIQFYNQAENKEEFFNDFFVKLAGTEELKAQITQGMSQKEIKKTWQPELEKFKQMRKKYLIYTD